MMMDLLMSKCLVQHAESWQNAASIFESQVKVCSFCLEAQRQLNLQPIASPIPVNMSPLESHEGSSLECTGESDDSLRCLLERIENKKTK